METLLKEDINLGASNIHVSEYQKADHRWGKAGRPLPELLKEIVRQEQNKQDFISPSNRMNYYENKLGTPKGAFPVRNMFHSQVASHLHDNYSMSKKNYDHLLEHEPELHAHTVNYFWRNRPNDEARLVRVLDGKARAYMSDRYAIFDNFELTQGVLEPIMNMKDVTMSVASAQVTERKLYLKFVSDIEGRVGKDVIYAGLEIGNSEVGASTVYWKMLFARVGCFNISSTALAYGKKHFGGRRSASDTRIEAAYSEDTRKLDTEVVKRKLIEGIQWAISPEVFNQELDKYRDAQGISIENTTVARLPKIVEVASKYHGLNIRETDNVMDLFFKEHDYTQYGLCQAITAASKDADYDRASEMEGIGHKVIEMKRSDWTGIYQEAAKN